MAEAERLALPDVVDARRPRRVAHRVEPHGVALGREGLLQLEGVVEVVLDGPLVPAGDHQDVVQPRRCRLLDDVLDGRLVDDRQHLLGRRLRGGQEAGTETGGRDDRLAHGAGGVTGVKGWGSIMRPMLAGGDESAPRATWERVVELEISWTNRLWPHTT
ncbi:hypothetical protein HDA41_001222 [Streptomyces caelestis]|uniref:Uncharacterized protein n=1 Tax=Streptomyces caelestis TaxID=36816 RepID=A0A7W9LR85_9ACTN|nr:hypothetical protein [Streptomyces caelestis]